MSRFAVAVMALASAACAEAESGPSLPPRRTVLGGEGAFFTYPALSPDGTRLAYGGPAGTSYGFIFVSNADGTNPVQVTHGVGEFDPAWSPDGRWLAYYSPSPDDDLFVVPSGGGEIRQLTFGPAEDREPAWLPDGSGIVFRRGGLGDDAIMFVPFEGGEARPLVAPMDGHQHGIVSPDGSRIVFDLHRGGQTTLWVTELPDGSPRQLTSEGFETFPHDAGSTIWSPDGGQLAYTSARTGTNDIWIADVATGELRQLTDDVRVDLEPRWSPDGSRIAFISLRGGQRDVWVMPAEGGAATRVTDDLDSEVALWWSPDSRRLFYRRADASTRVMRMPSDGGEASSVAGWDGYTSNQPDVSPDGRSVVFTSNRSGNTDIWGVPLEGGEPTPLATSPVADTDPEYSPDGRQVAFVSLRGGSNDIWVVTATGGEARRLTDWPSSEISPRWSPDGEIIAFLSNRDGGRYDVWIIPGGGGEPRRLTSGGALYGTFTGLLPVPTWAPDGSAIYYLGGAPSGLQEAYRVSVAGGRPQPLGGSADAEYIASISPDGRGLTYLAWEGPWSFTEVVPTAGGTPRRIAESEQVWHNGSTWSPDGSFLVISSNLDLGVRQADLHAVPWPEGAWRKLTSTPTVTEDDPQFTPDGRQIVFTANQISVRVDVAEVGASDLPR